MAVIDADGLATATGLSLEVATRLRGVCLAIVEKYATAPDEIVSESLIRMSSYIDSSRAGLAVRELKATDALSFRISCSWFGTTAIWHFRAIKSLGAIEKSEGALNETQVAVGVTS